MIHGIHGQGFIVRKVNFFRLLHIFAVTHKLSVQFTVAGKFDGDVNTFFVLVTNISILTPLELNFPFSGERRKGHRTVKVRSHGNAGGKSQREKKNRCVQSEQNALQTAKEPSKENSPYSALKVLYMGVFGDDFAAVDFWGGAMPDSAARKNKFRGRDQVSHSKISHYSKRTTIPK